MGAEEGRKGLCRGTGGEKQRWQTSKWAEEEGESSGWEEQHMPGSFKEA